jgi:surface protein
MLGCSGISSININGGCSSSVAILEVSYDGGVMYSNAGTGPWYFEDSNQLDSEVKFKATIRKIGCPDQFVTASFYPDEECLTGAFITEWNVNEGDQIVIPTYSPLTYNYSVDWGDESVTNNISESAYHTYSSSGTYEVKILGTFPRIYFNSVDLSTKNKLTKIKKWGNIEWESFGGAFVRCENLEITATDTPNLNNVVNLSSMFNGCISLTDIPNVGSWDLSNITNINAMFYSSSFNGNVGSWNTSNVENFEYTFGRCLFNNSGSDSIKNWDVANAKNMGLMFVYNTSFNQPLTNWDVSSCESFLQAFYGASSFNQDLSNFNISGIITGSVGSPSPSLLMMFDMSGLSTSNYDKILNKFASTATNKNLEYVELGAAGINYTTAGSGSRNTLVNTLGWTITDAGII